MIAITSIAPQTPPATSPATPPATPDLSTLAEQFTSIATKLTASNATIASMVADKSPVGAGWAPHLNTIAGALQTARDEFLVAKPDAAADLGAKLGVDVLKLSEASGSLSIMARQRATLSEGWKSFLDATIADATAAAALLAPPAKDPKADPPAADAVPVAAAAVAGRSVAATTPAGTIAGTPGDVDYCRTPEFIGH